MPRRCPAVVLALLLSALPAAADGQSCRLLPLAVRNGSCQAVVPTPRAFEQYLLIVGSLAPGTARHLVQVEAVATVEPESVDVESTEVDPAWWQRVALVRRQLERARHASPPEAAYPPAAAPPQQRSFYLFVRQRDFADPAAYVTVLADLRAVGRRCQVYADRALAGRDLRALTDDILTTFDEQIYPQPRLAAVRCPDVNRDGRFTVLLTPWVGRLCDGKVRLDGFVRGSDLLRDVAPPFSNRCDMMYLNPDVAPGPYLRTLLAHEYTHGVVFGEHYLRRYLPQQPPRDEESWLGEALAHVAEDLHCFSWANLDYRVSAFLAEPWRHGLVVPDAYAAGLWRSPGHRGACYLFLSWCVDQFGADLPTALVRSGLSGIDNLEVATLRPFAELFRGWSAAVALGGSGLAVEGVAPLRRLDLHGPLGDRRLCGVSTRPLSLGGGTCEVDLAGTASACVLLHSPAGKRSRVTVTAAPEAALQVSLIRLPAALPRLELRADEVGPGKVRLTATAHGAAATVVDACWERPDVAERRAEDTSFRPAEAPGVAARRWFDDVVLAPGKPRSSTVLTLPAGGRWLFKVLCVDGAGRRLGATTVVETGR